jgi:hypothetical protein
MIRSGFVGLSADKKERMGHALSLRRGDIDRKNRWMIVPSYRALSREPEKRQNPSIQKAMEGLKVIVGDCQPPDGIAIDVGAGHIYWTNMGFNPGVNDGSIERADIDRKNRWMIVPRGATFTPR